MAKQPSEEMVSQHLLKATFFNSQLEELKLIGIHEKATKALRLIEDQLDWKQHEALNIPLAVVEKVKLEKRNLAQLVCHPVSLISHPWLLTYFRCLAVFSQKGLGAVSGVSSVKAIENGKDCTPMQAEKLSYALNGNLCAILATGLPSSEKMKGLFYATSGATLEGSWRNQIGSEGERIFKSIVLNAIWNLGELATLSLKNGSSFQVKSKEPSWLEANVNDVRAAVFTNGATATFSSEPDVTLTDSQAKIVAGIEIKAGLDPAAALERLGAMLKSFDRIKLEAPNAETILVASCITPEVQTRISGAGGVTRTFLLNDIIRNKSNRATHIVSIIRGLLGLAPKQR